MTKEVCYGQANTMWFSILQNSRRQYMIEYLKSCNGNLTLDDLVEYLTELEKDTSNAKNLRRSIKISIIQTHLPVLERAGIVSFDQHTKEINLIKIPDNTLINMSLLDKTDISWEMYYIVLSIVGVAGALAVSQWLAISALVGVTLGALVQKRGRVQLRN